MANPRKLWRVVAIIDNTVLHDLMMLIEGKCVGAPEMVPVRHGGADENGEIKPPPSPRDIILDYITKFGELRLGDVKAAGASAGLSNSAITNQVYKLANDKVIKRVDKGAYALNTSKLKKVKALPAPNAARTGKRAGPTSGARLMDRIVAFVRSKQNGSGEGVSLDDIKAASVAMGFAVSGVNAALYHCTAKEKTLKRVGLGMYRTSEHTAAAA